MSQLTANYSLFKTFISSKVLKVFGVTFFTVENGKSVTKIVDVLCMVFFILLGVFVCYFSVTMRSDLADQKSKISNVGNFLAFIASVVIIILSTLITFIFRHKIWSLAQKLDVIEQKVRI